MDSHQPDINRNLPFDIFTAISQSIDGIALIDWNRNVQFVNHAWAEMHGCTPQEAAGQPMDFFHTPEQMEKEIRPFARKIDLEGRAFGEIGHKRKDGTTFPTWMSATVVRDLQGTPVGVIVIARDFSDLAALRRSLEKAQFSLEAEVQSRTRELEVVSENFRREISDRKRVERALREAMRTSADIVASMPAGLFIYQYDPVGRLIFLDGNFEAQRLTGLDVTQWRGCEFNEIWNGIGGSDLFTALLKVMETGEQFESDDFFYRDDRMEGHFKIRGFQMPGNRLGYAFEDVTERKRAERALKESEERFRSIFNGVIDGIYVESLEGVIEDVNPAACKMLGYDRDELIGMNARDMIPPLLAEKLQDIAGDVVHKGGVHFEAMNLKKDGTTIPVDVTINPIIIEGASKVAVIVRDVTDRKKAERELQESEQKFRSLFELSRDAVFLIEADDLTIFDINVTAADLMGWPQEEFSRIGFRSLFPQDKADEYVRIVTEHAESGIPIEEDLEVIHCQGDIRPVNVAANVVELKGQRILQVVMRDMTVRKELEKELTRRADEIELLNDILTHDVSNLNQTNLTYVNMLLAGEGGGLSEDQSLYLQACKKQIVRTSSLMDKVKMMSLARDESAGKLISHNLSNVIVSVINAVRSSVQDRNVHIDYEPVPEAHALADRLIHQLFYNLFENALRHNRSDAPELKIRLRDEQNGSRLFWKIMIEDNGPGIRDDLKKIIFNRFEKGGKRKGTGVGLAIVKALAHKYHGTVYVEDRIPGDQSQGSRFIVLLPMARPARD